MMYFKDHKYAQSSNYTTENSEKSQPKEIQSTEEKPSAVT